MTGNKEEEDLFFSELVVNKHGAEVVMSGG
jgi:hypothetical protein